MTVTTAREIHLTAYPSGTPTPDMFAMKDVAIPELGQGEFLQRQIWMSVDPYMRGRMNPHVKSYIPPFQLNEALDGGAVGEVVASNNPNFPVGAYVASNQGGWRDYYVTKGVGAYPVDPNVAPLSAYIGVLGMPGLTAWAGTKFVLEPKAGETLFVSGAAGAVGSFVCQMGKILGLRVVGTAGSDEKCAWLKDELGVDAAINYKTAGNLTKALMDAAPDGIDCYFENVGGAHLEAALNVMNEHGRIAVCGMIAQYNNEKPEPGPSNLTAIIARRLKVQGLLVMDYMDKSMDFFAEAGGWLAEGKLKYKETVFEGLESAPEAFLGLFSGANTGKAVVRIGADK